MSDFCVQSMTLKFSRLMDQSWHCGQGQGQGEFGYEEAWGGGAVILSPSNQIGSILQRKDDTEMTAEWVLRGE